MTKLLYLIKWEFLVQNRVHNLTKYLFAFFLFCTLSITLINNHSDIKKFGVIFSCIYLPLALLAFSGLIFKSDEQDGTLELMMINFNPGSIVIAKFLSILACALLSLAINLPIIFIIFDMSIHAGWHLMIALLLLLVLSATLLVLSGAVQAYFRSNTNFLAILIMPLMIPSIIMTGLILQDPANIHLSYIMLGIDLIVIPTVLVLSSYLVKNIYNI